MSDKHNDDEYFFDDDELDSFASELDDKKSEENETADTEKTSTGDYDNFVESEGEPALEEDEPSDFNDEEALSKSDLLGKVKTFSSKHTRLLLAAGGAVVAVIVFSFILSPTKQQKLMASAPVKQAPVQVAAPVVVQQAPSVSKQQMNSVSRIVSSNKNGLNALQSRLGNMSAKQADTGDAISQLSAQIQQVESSNQQLLAQVKVIEKREQDRVKKESYKKTHYVHYQVQALESGRAWLIGSNGLTTTVSVGSKLPHYGDVLTVDVDNGTVVTSSGDTIKYGMERLKSAATK